MDAVDNNINLTDDDDFDKVVQTSILFGMLTNKKRLKPISCN